MSEASNLRKTTYRLYPTPKKRAIRCRACAEERFKLGNASAAMSLLVNVARAAFRAADDSEEIPGDNGREHRIDSANFDALCNALGALDDLPDDQPGYVMTGPARAEWALRDLLCPEKIAATPAALAQQSAQHPDDLAVDRFAVAMKEKLALARAKGRGGWNDPAQCSVERLATMLVEHIAKGDPVDVANFAMMLHQRGAGLEVLAQQSLQQEQDRIDAERYRWLRDNRDSDWKICEWDGDEYVCDGRAPEIVDACIDVARKGGSNG